MKELTKNEERIEKFLNKKKKNNYSPTTIRCYKNVLEKHKDNLDDIRALRKKILSYENANTCNLHKRTLASFFTFERNLTKLEQLREIKTPQDEMKYREVFTKSFLIRRTEVHENDNNTTKQKKLIIRFLFETGIRVSELETLDGDWRDETLIVKGKGNKIREIFFVPETLRQIEPESLKVSTKTIREWTKDILGEKFAPHSIRRSFATHMLKSGANPKMVQLQMGHAKIETTFRYLNLSKKDNKNIYNKFI